MPDLLRELRLQVPGGSLTIQDLRDLVGWAGASRARSFRLGDAQDLVLEGFESDPGTAPSRVRVRDQGSLQSSAFGEAPTPSLPWLTTGVWMDLLSSLPDPGALDVQIVHEPVHALFVRHGHLRLTAKKAAHQWEVYHRRPGSDRLTAPGAIDTGDVPAAVEAARSAWEARDDRFWQGEPAEPAKPGAPLAGREGFHRETATSFSFGLAPPSGRVSVNRLRDVTWLASETGASRVWLTPGRVLLFEGLPVGRKKDWVEWLTRNGVPELHGDLDHSVCAAGWGRGCLEAQRTVVENLRARDRLPPERRLLVADEALNRGDGVSSLPFPVLIRTLSSWLFRSGDGLRSGEGTLDEVLDALEAVKPASSSAPPPPPSASGHRCPACLTVYDAKYGDPQNGVPAGTPFDALSLAWTCPVCGGPKEDFVSQETKRDQ